MDLQSILPLLNLNGKNKDMEKIISMMSSNKEDVLKNFASSSDPKTSAILSMLQNSNPKKQYLGLSPIKEIANDEIFGRLTKHFLSQKS
ncbi:MAG: hypothetical protein E7353_02920 [Clostridiales bacterium]|nr:hypothetical protein [Clostridiales bacterium]